MTFELLYIVLYTEEKPIGERRNKMLTLHPNILEKDGKKEFAILPMQSFKKYRKSLKILKISGFFVKQRQKKQIAQQFHCPL